MHIESSPNCPKTDFRLQDDFAETMELERRSEWDRISLLEDIYYEISMGRRKFVF